jgi:phospholipase C
VKATETTPYFAMAKQYGLGDNFFSDQLDSSYVAHQYLISGQAGNAENVPTATPWGCDAPKGTTVGIANTKGQIVSNVFPCFTYTTLGNELDSASQTWRYYAPGSTDAAYIWSAYDAVNSIREGTDWSTKVVSPQCSVLSDIAAGKLATVTWVVPNLPDSDHPLSLSKTGPAWVASIVNAVGKSPFWDSTAIFVTWDDWGGFYDHVVPPNYGKFWDGPGIRVPFIAIGAYAKKGVISHTQYQTASILKSMEIWLGLKQMGWADTAAAPFWQDFFDFTQTPRKFTPIAHAKYTCQPALSTEPPDTDF